MHNTSRFNETDNMDDEDIIEVDDEGFVVETEGSRRTSYTIQDVPAPRIRDDIPLPKQIRKQHSKWQFIFDLEVGQSATFRNEDLENPDKFQRNLGACAYKHAKLHGKKFAVTKTRDSYNNITGVGIWRVK